MRRSVWVAGAIALALAGWLGSGHLELPTVGPESAAVGAAAPTAPAEPRRLAVRVATSTAERISRDLVLYGRTEAGREVTMRAETYGRVVEAPADQGQFVEVGQQLLALDPRERQAMVAKAEAAVRQRELEQAAAESLGRKGFQAENLVAEVEAELAAARAELRERQVELESTRLKAPFAGLLEERHVEIGDFVEIGDPLFMLIEQDPYLVTAEVPETQRRWLRPGMKASMVLADGSEASGELTYIASRADAETRTFKLEITVENPNQRFPAGMTATVRIHRDTVLAHRLPASILALDPEGKLGISIVDKQDRVRFLHTTIVKSEAGAIWLGDLPTPLRVIVVGQGFTHPGDLVTPVEVELDGGPQSPDVAQVPR